jgi:hypothetical protein
MIVRQQSWGKRENKWVQTHNRECEQREDGPDTIYTGYVEEMANQNSRGDENTEQKGVNKR